MLAWHNKINSWHQNKSFVCFLTNIPEQPQSVTRNTHFSSVYWWLQGHQHGLHIFTVRPRSHFPTSTLARHNHCPITDLSISPDGHSMVTISLQSMDVCLWNLTDYSVVKLFGYFTAPNFLVRWSPTGLRVAVGKISFTCSLPQLLLQHISNNILYCKDDVILYCKDDEAL